MASGIETTAGSTVTDVEWRMTPDGASVAGSSTTMDGGSVEVPTWATIPGGPTRIVPISV